LWRAWRIRNNPELVAQSWVADVVAVTATLVAIALLYAVAAAGGQKQIILGMGSVFWLASMVVIVGGLAALAQLSAHKRKGPRQ
jgi:hypothetical protein